MASYDEFMLQIGHFGVYQKLLLFVFAIYPLTLPLICMTSRFSLETVTHQCDAEAQSYTPSSSFKNEFFRREKGKTIALENNETQEDSCHIIYQWSVHGSQNLTNASDSNSGYLKDKVKCKSFRTSNKFMETTATSDFQLFCDRKYLKSVAEVVFPIGMMVGLLVAGQVGDMIGRKPVLIASILINMVACALEGITVNITSFLITRFTVGFGCTVLYLAFFTIGCEMVPEDKVLLFGFIGESFYGLGLASLALVAHLLRKWRYINLVGGALAIPALIAACFSPESLRWLVTTGKRERAETLARQIASINGKEFGESVRASLHSAIAKMAADKEEKTQESAIKEFLLLLKIFRTPKLNVRVLILALCWAVTCGVYFSFSISGSLIPGNIFVNLAVMGFLETPAMCLTYPIGVKFGRRFLNAGALLFAGASCTLMVFTTSYDYKIPSQILAQCGRFGVTITFAVVYIYSSELIPTCARVTGLSFCSLTARAITIATPYIILLGENFWKPSIYLFYGSLGLLAGSVALTLPETLNCTLQDNFEDAILFEGSKKNYNQATIANESMEKSDKNGLSPNNDLHVETVEKGKDVGVSHISTV